MDPRYLHRRHKVHVELDHHVKEAFHEHDPLFGLRLQNQVCAGIQDEQDAVEQDRERDEKVDRSKNHPLLKDEVRDDHDHDESEERPLGIPNERPSIVLSGLRQLVVDQSHIEAGSRGIDH